LGLSQALHKKQINLTLHCHQNVKGLHQKALAFFQREAISGLKTQPFSGEGSEFDSLVEFTHGMDNRLIDWKRSARHLALLAKEFRQEKNHQIILGFDIGRLTTEPLEGLPKIDHFVKAGLTLAWVCLMSGDMVGAVSFGLNFENFLKPGRGRNYFAKIQRFTASLDYRLEETNFTATLVELKNRLPHRSLIVIFTEFIDSITAEFLIEGLALLAKRHMVLFVTMPDAALIGLRNRKPESFIDMAGSIIADNFVRERAIVLERTARLGVFAIDAPPKSLSTAILNRYLIIKQRGLL
jgi:uncharacterized protein (DUF58 family)